MLCSAAVSASACSPPDKWFVSPNRGDAQTSHRFAFRRVYASGVYPHAWRVSEVDETGRFRHLYMFYEPAGPNGERLFRWMLCECQVSARTIQKLRRLMDLADFLRLPEHLPSDGFLVHRQRRYLLRLDERSHEVFNEWDLPPEPLHRVLLEVAGMLGFCTRRRQPTTGTFDGTPPRESTSREVGDAELERWQRAILDGTELP